KVRQPRMNAELREQAGHSSFEVAIVGAGPAGLAAAEALSGHGIKAVVIDEQPRAGGQILRQPPEKFRVAGWMTAPLYRKTKQLLDRTVPEPGAAWLFSTTVLGIVREQNGRFRLWIQNTGGCGSIT